MRIRSIEAWRASLKLSEPYAIAYDSYDTAENVFFRIDTGTTGLQGYGCACPDPHVTGETPEDVLEVLSGTVAALLRNGDPLRPVFLLERTRRALPDRPAALAAVDMALFDLLGKASSQPVWRLLGGYRDRFMTSITIGILDERATVERARAHVARGFRALKLKGGRDVEDDIARVRRVREAVGERVELRFDANQGYTVAQATAFLAGVRGSGLRILEQPTVSDQPNLLEAVPRSETTSVMADESLVSRGDAFRLARGRLVDLVNVKLMKVGGIDEALRVSAVASAGGIQTMVGCMDEVALGIAAGLHFALARPSIAYADLDGHFDIVDDPTDGAVILQDGSLLPADAPGLGSPPPG